MLWRSLHPSGFIGKLKEPLPHRLPESNNAIQPIDEAVAFVQGLLCGAEKLTHVAYLRRDPVVPAITGIKRVSSQSTLSRFFAVFDTPGNNQRCLGPMTHKARWRYGGITTSAPVANVSSRNSTKISHCPS